MIPPERMSCGASHQQGQALHELARNKVCLEVGAWVGYTTICMAKTAQIVYSIDGHEGDIHIGHYDTFSTYYDNLRQYRVLDKVAMLVGYSTEILLRLPKDYFDLVFIDATHTYEACKKDTELCWSLVKRGGIMTWHDYDEGREVDPNFGVTKAVDEAIEKYGLIKIGKVETLLICQVPNLS